MSRILFLVPYPLHNAPSQRFRFEQYFDILRQRGHQYTVQSFLDEATWNILYLPGFTLKKFRGILAGFTRRFLVLFRLSNYDFVFIHREASPVGPPVFEWLIAKFFRKKIIFDFDDAIWLPNTSGENKIAASLKWHSKTGSICRWAYRCSCGNDFLAAYARKFNKNVVVNPTTIDTQHHHKGLKNQAELPVKIGWTGTHTTLKYLELLMPVLRKINENLSFTLVVISNKKPELDFPALEYVPWNKSTEIDDLLRFHIGVMPLTDDDWSRGKCGFKALQYMSLGIPAVVSPVGVNNKIVDHGINGFLCDSPEEWEVALKRLLTDTALRQMMGRAAQLKIEQCYSVQSNARNFLSLFE
ncbi:MAG: glycosyltransferase family 4 protein [Chitinophagales bacterium]|nr:glycosyltransferase family 4 protein [Chitinophagales bacterium]MDW8274071.1 glycosyltransferase family 4 protein [Chitinophagales bacterium]